ncbi:MAG: hypothetical protein M5U01_22850 [Ardenticatenaceae bacterium]|nr:hypothetical protein [Ardenticatenaceae bacterium]
MTTEDIIIALFCEVDDRLGDEPRHPQARLWPSELVTIGRLFVLKGVQFRAFSRWLKRDDAALFVRLPHRTRLLRALQVHQAWTDRLLADPTFFTVVDSYGIELIHPIREGRSRAQIGRKGKSNHRWIVGIKLCWLINDKGEVVDWAWSTANAHDQWFLPMIERYEGRTITLSDTGFECADGVPSNLKMCPRGPWNERMLIETALSMVTMVCRLKHIFHRVEAYAEMHLAYISALFNMVLALNRTLAPDAEPED